MPLPVLRDGRPCFLCAVIWPSGKACFCSSFSQIYHPVVSQLAPVTARLTMSGREKHCFQMNSCFFPWSSHQSAPFSYSTLMSSNHRVQSQEHRWGETAWYLKSVCLHGSILFPLWCDCLTTSSLKCIQMNTFNIISGVGEFIRQGFWSTPYRKGWKQKLRIIVHSTTEWFARSKLVIN